LTPPLLLIVTGLPCSGKTTVAKKLALDLSMPLVTKDDIKERLFDTLGWSDRAWSRQVGQATYSILFYFIETMLAGGVSLIVESNFLPVMATERFVELREKYPFRAGIVECIARSEVLKDRWRRRAEHATRHPGHNDAEALEEFLDAVDLYTGTDGYGRLGAPDLDAPVWYVDTTEHANLDSLIVKIGVRFSLNCDYS